MLTSSGVHAGAMCHLTQVSQVTAKGCMLFLAVDPERKEHEEAGHAQSCVQEADQPHDQQQHQKSQ